MRRLWPLLPAGNDARLRRLPLLVPPLLLSAAPSITTMTTRPPFGGLVFMAPIIVVAMQQRCGVRCLWVGADTMPGGGHAAVAFRIGNPCRRGFRRHHSPSADLSVVRAI